MHGLWHKVSPLWFMYLSQISPLPTCCPAPLQLERGASGPLPHLSLVEVGGIQLLFLVNPLAVQRAIVRSEQLVM